MFVNGKVNEKHNAPPPVRQEFWEKKYYLAAKMLLVNAILRGPLLYPLGFECNLKKYARETFKDDFVSVYGFSKMHEKSYYYLLIINMKKSMQKKIHDYLDA
jgi:hypothetical protein